MAGKRKSKVKRKRAPTWGRTVEKPSPKKINLWNASIAHPVGKIKPRFRIPRGTSSRGHQHPPRAAIVFATRMLRMMRISIFLIKLPNKILIPAIVAQKKKATKSIERMEGPK